MRWWILLLCAVMFDSLSLGLTANKHSIVAYWGQGSGQEADLKYYCQNFDYDVIAVAFVTDFFAGRDFPKMNLARHCGMVMGDGYDLLSCAFLAPDIEECQRRGKKVLISLGGQHGGYNMTDPKLGPVLADNIWNLFLGGTRLGSLRPFGRAILDGVDLDIERGSDLGYPSFVARLRALMDADPSRPYIISGAPQCPFPDAWLHKSLQEQGQHFDELYVQYYNNYCYPGKPVWFNDTLINWFNLAQSIINRYGKGPKIFIGLPAHTKAAGETPDQDLDNRMNYYLYASTVANIFQSVKHVPVFGGFMLWDAGWDFQNLWEGLYYSQYIRQVLNGKVWPPKGVTTPSTSRTPSSSTGGSSPSVPGGSDPTPGPTIATREPLQPGGNYQLVVAWGQNGAGAVPAELKYEAEYPLSRYCQDPHYDVITINMVTRFFGRADLPAMDLSVHCGVKFANTDLLNCAELLATQMKDCQSRGKKLLITLGGVDSILEFPSDNAAKNFAYTIWDLFLGGQDATNRRPFGKDVILDGVNINIKNGRADYWSTFLDTLKEKMTSDGKRAYQIGATTTCRFPDVLGSVLVAKRAVIDFVLVYFDAKWCEITRTVVLSTLDTWIGNLRPGGVGPLVYIGFFAGDPVYSGMRGNFMSVALARQIAKELVNYPGAGGFYLWDASWSTNNKMLGLPFSDYIGEAVHPGKLLKLAIYWGQNTAAGTPNARQEKNLATYCDRPQYDTIIAGAVGTFNDAGNNEDGLPGMEFSKHCFTPFGTGYRTFLTCPVIGQEVAYCQSKGKVVLLTLGGTARYNGFENEVQANDFADRVWNLFLGGTSTKRSFGNTVFDGVNLDITLGSPDFFANFVETLRSLMNQDTSRTYYITATLRCPYEMGNLALRPTIEKKTALFDSFYVQFTDQMCSINGSSFEKILNQWLQLPVGPKIYVGLPASDRKRNSASFFASVKKIEEVYRDYFLRFSRLGGISLDDASWDDNNIIEGEYYSFYVGRILKPDSNKVVTTTPPTPEPTGEPDVASYIKPSRILLVVTAILAVFNLARLL